jgi:hypothetical protein
MAAAAASDFGQSEQDFNPHACIHTAPPTATNQGAARGSTATDRWDPHVSVFPMSNNSKIGYSRGKNSQAGRKNLKTNLGVGNQIWNTFHNWHFFQIFTDFELFQRFRVKVGLTGFVLN